MIQPAPTATPWAVPRMRAGKISETSTQFTVPDCLKNTNRVTRPSTTQGRCAGTVAAIAPVASRCGAMPKPKTRARENRAITMPVSW